MGRPPCCDKSNVKRGLWSAEEDAKILAHVSKHGTGNWTLVPKKAGLNRCGKSCRLRWTNYLRPDLNHDDFTPQEEDHIINLHQAVGSRWSLIAKQLPGRTDNDVKNYWNTKLRKKLYKMGIDPLTHKPFSQVLSEFGTVTSFPSPQPPPNDHSLQLLNPQQQPQFFNEQSSSSCSSSTSSIISSSPSTTSTNWTEFLIQEPGDNNIDHHHYHQELLQGLFSSSSSSTTQVKSCESRDDLGLNIILDDNNNNNNSSGNSFVDTIMDQDSELRSAFPEFLDESLEYY